MKKTILCLLYLLFINNSLMAKRIMMAPQPLTAQALLSLGRISPIGISNDAKSFLYKVSTPNIDENKSETTTYAQNLETGDVTEYTEPKAPEVDNASFNNKTHKIVFTKEILIKKVKSTDLYPNLTKSEAYVYTDLNYRHWDQWEDGSFAHVFIADYNNGIISNEKDIMQGEPYDCPQKPNGGAEDVILSPDGKTVVYVCKKKYGKAYAISTNTNIYAYDITSGSTTVLSEGLMGYNIAPAFSNDGKNLAWLSMKRDGFEADKQDIVVMDWKTKTKTNLTKNWDETIESFKWNNTDNKIFYTAPFKGTVQLYEINLQKNITLTNENNIRQVSNGQWDVNEIIAEKNNTIYATRSDMNHANEVYSINIATGEMTQVTHINDQLYSRIAMCQVRPRYTKATDGKKLFSWVIYPPNFDSTKKYPTLLYCQGGPQGAISQFYSFRWNFQLMASQGYIVVIPNRRGCTGWGVKWLEDISKDWGGQPIKDYLSAFDDIAKEPYVDKKRCGAVGASYGGYSVYMLAGVHNNRFKSFIAHDGLFDLKSWYGTTEEMWFANWDIGGNYWDGNANKSYEKFNPSNFVSKWNTPIMVVQGGVDYRVPIEQGLQAFQAAQFRGLKSKLLYLPKENHWVLKPQNAIVWHSEFYKWLDETLK